jgi:hypothetical protein
VIGPDAEGDDDIVLRGERGGFFQLRGKGVRVLDQRIGRQEDDDRVGIEPPHERGAERAGRGGVPFRGLGNELRGRQVRHRGAARLDLRGVGENKNVFERQRAFHAPDGFFQHGALAQQRHEMLGCGDAAERPEAFAAAARHDAGVGFHSIFFIARGCEGASQVRDEVMRTEPRTPPAGSNPDSKVAGAVLLPSAGPSEPRSGGTSAKAGAPNSVILSEAHEVRAVEGPREQLPLL